MRASHETIRRQENDDAPTAGPTEPNADALPRGWQVVPFLQAVRKSNAHVGMVRRTDYLQSGRFPIIDQGQSMIAGYWDSDEEAYQAELPVIVFGDHTRVFKFIDFPFIAGAQGTHVLLPDSSRFDPYFLYLALASLSIPSRGYNRHFSLLKEQSIAAPPLPEQRAIASVLRWAQRAKEACERGIAATRRLKQSLLTYLFTYGPIPVDLAERVPLKETEIGSMPKHWRLVRLGDVADIGNGSTPKRTEPRYWSPGTIPWLTSGKVHDGTIRSAEEFVTSAAREERHLPFVPAGSIVIAITGQGKTLGNSARLEIDACVSQHLAYVALRREDLSADFVLAFLRSQYDHLQAISRSGGSTKGALTCGLIKSLIIPEPPASEQEAIASHLNSLDAKLAAEEARRAALDNLFKSLFHHLMTAKVRVNHLIDQLAGQPAREGAS